MRTHVAVALLVAAGCKQETPPKIAPASKAATPASRLAPSPEAAAPSAPGLTGALTEEGFKALHEHKAGAAPAATGEMIEIAGSRAYLSLPPGAKAPVPGIVVIHEWWGLNDNIKHWSDRLAADGYAALAVDLYGGQVATKPDDAMRFMKAVDGAAAQAILTAAHDFLGADARVAASKRAVIGWCFGGGWSLKHALATPDLDAAVMYYGHLVTDGGALGGLQAELLGVFAEKDTGIPIASVDEFEAALKAAGKKASILRFPAEHAFANPSSARYDERSAAAAWREVRAFLEATLR